MYYAYIYIILNISLLLKAWYSGINSNFLTWELVRDADFQTPWLTYRIKICILTRPQVIRMHMRAWEALVYVPVTIQNKLISIYDHEMLVNIK